MKNIQAFCMDSLLIGVCAANFLAFTLFFARASMDISANFRVLRTFLDIFFKLLLTFVYFWILQRVFLSEY